MGLVNAVVPEGTALDAAIALAEEAASMAPLVSATLKRFVTEHTLAQTPSERMARAMRDLGQVNTSRDRDEGIAAFLEKRPPDFEGR
jgi:enoyl-CoA hydratase/carnithine racemase